MKEADKTILENVKEFRVLNDEANAWYLVEEEMLFQLRQPHRDLSRIETADGVVVRIPVLLEKELLVNIEDFEDEMAFMKLPVEHDNEGNTIVTFTIPEAKLTKTNRLKREHRVVPVFSQTSAQQALDYLCEVATDGDLSAIMQFVSENFHAHDF